MDSEAFLHDRKLCRALDAGVGFEHRQDLLSNKSDRITTHYSAPDIAILLEAAESVCVRRPNTVLRIAAHTIPKICTGLASGFVVLGANL